jgi:hypothetical protein
MSEAQEWHEDIQRNFRSALTRQCLIPAQFTWEEITLSHESTSSVDNASGTHRIICSSSVCNRIIPC